VPVLPAPPGLTPPGAPPGLAPAAAAPAATPPAAPPTVCDVPPKEPVGRFLLTVDGRLLLASTRFELNSFMALRAASSPELLLAAVKFL